MNGDTITFNCKTKTYMGDGAEYSVKMEITDPSGTKLKSIDFTDSVKDQKEFNLTHDHIFVGYGVQMFFCSMHYYAEKGQWKITHNEFKTLNVTIYRKSFKSSS